MLFYILFPFDLEVLHSILGRVSLHSPWARTSEAAFSSPLLSYPSQSFVRFTEI